MGFHRQRGRFLAQQAREIAQNALANHVGSDDSRQRLTIFTTPKPFAGHIGLIQRNAIASWLRLPGAPRVLLFSNDPDARRVCEELGIELVIGTLHLDDGALLLNDMFTRVTGLSDAQMLCYVNCDIMLCSDFVEALDILRARLTKFMMVGRRWQVAIKEAWNFDAPDWEDCLRDHVRTHGSQPPPPGNSDFFAFTRDLWGTSLIPLGVGRGSWEAWLVYEARRRQAPVVDVSQSVSAIHQDHDQSSYAGGLREWWRQVRRNEALCGPIASRFTLLDATHVLIRGKLKRPSGTPYLRRRIVTRLERNGRSGALAGLVNVLRHIKSQLHARRSPALALYEQLRAQLPTDGMVGIIGLGPGAIDSMSFARFLLSSGQPVVIYEADDSLLRGARGSLSGPVAFVDSEADCRAASDVVVLTLSGSVQAAPGAS